MWLKEATPLFNLWQDAWDYFDNLQLAGYDDWRVPEIWELFRIVDKQRSPAIDPVFGPFSRLCWSATAYAGLDFYVWSVDFADGTVHAVGKGGFNVSVRAVRNGPLFSGLAFVDRNGDTNGDGQRDISDAIYLLSWLFNDGPAPVPLSIALPDHFHDNGDGTVSDSTTGLVWQQESTVGEHDWALAQDLCSNLQLGSHDDWRLPEVWELFSIVDWRHDPPVDPVLSRVRGGNWSLTTVASDPDSAWWVYFPSGSVFHLEKDLGLAVVAVRTGP
jgi:hypothetical protein